MSTFDKFVQMFLAIFLFLAVMGVVLFIADRVRSRKGEVVQTTVFVLPVVVMVAFGLLYPAIRTIRRLVPGREQPELDRASTTTRRSSPTPRRSTCCGTPRCG